MSDISAIDHLVVAGPSLYELEPWWKAKTGVAARRGGSHPGVGTWNSLVGVGPRTYVELIAPDPAQPTPLFERPFRIDHLTVPTLVTFAVAVSDIELAVDLVADQGIDPGSIRSMSRVQPDGVELTWRLAIPPDPYLAGVMPFLIQWGDHHPCDNLVQYLDLVDLILHHPEPAPIENAIAAATDTKIIVKEGPAELAGRLHTDNGVVDISSVRR